MHYRNKVTFRTKICFTNNIPYGTYLVVENSAKNPMHLWGDEISSSQARTSNALKHKGRYIVSASIHL